jgi:hypothetical protein
MYKKATIMSACLLLVIATGWTLVQAQVPYRVSDREVEQLLKRIRNGSDRFRKSLDSALDRSRLDGTNREDDINAFVKDFDKETDRLYDRFKDHKSVSGDVETVLDRAVRIDRFMRRQQFRNDKAQRNWEAVRADLDQLAQDYSVTWDWQR